jgi:hypothetical protein
MQHPQPIKEIRWTFPTIALMANLAKNCRRIIIGNPEKSLIAEILTAKMTFPGFNHQSVQEESNLPPPNFRAMAVNGWREC